MPTWKACALNWPPTLPATKSARSSRSNAGKSLGLTVPPALSIATKAPPQAEPTPGVVWEPAMLEKTKRELAVYIGPMAKFIVDSTASEVHTMGYSLDARCREIPSSRDRERFLSRCKAGI